MNIAVIAPVIRKISLNSSYGGIERIITSLVIGTADKGHNVTLYAPFGTDLKHKNIKIIFTTKQDIYGEPELIEQAEKKLFKKLVEDQERFDIIHSHVEPAIADNSKFNYFSYLFVPTVVTFHNQTYIDENINYYKNHPDLHQLHYVFISKNQAKPLYFLPNQTVIYNGIDLKKFDFNSEPNPNQLAFLGRIAPEKGITQAIDVARITKKILLIGAAIDKVQTNFFNDNVSPRLDNQITYLGEVNDKEKNKLLGSSTALLFPIQWQEPFGLVVVESLATGTPVIAPNLGSMPEIIEDGKNGFIIDQPDNISMYANAVNKVEKLDREYCRKSIEKRFSNKTMLDNYLKLYSSLVNDQLI